MLTVARGTPFRRLWWAGAVEAVRHVGQLSHLSASSRLRAAADCPLRPVYCRCRGVDTYEHHALACPQTGLLARRATIVERAWVRVARTAVRPDEQIVSQQWLPHTTSLGVPSDDRRKLDLVVYGAAPRGSAMCCDAALVSFLTLAGQTRKALTLMVPSSGPRELQTLG